MSRCLHTIALTVLAVGFAAPTAAAQTWQYAGTTPFGSSHLVTVTGQGLKAGTSSTFLFFLHAESTLPSHPTTGLFYEETTLAFSGARGFTRCAIVGTPRRLIGPGTFVRDQLCEGAADASAVAVDVFIKSVTGPNEPFSGPGTRYTIPLVTLSQVPEPTTWATFGTGLLALGVAAQRRRRADRRA